MSGFKRGALRHQPGRPGADAAQLASLGQEIRECGCYTFRSCDCGFNPRKIEDDKKNPVCGVCDACERNHASVKRTGRNGKRKCTNPPANVLRRAVQIGDKTVLVDNDLLEELVPTEEAGGREVQSDTESGSETGGLLDHQQSEIDEDTSEITQGSSNLQSVDTLFAPNKDERTEFTHNEPPNAKRCSIDMSAKDRTELRREKLLDLRASRIAFSRRKKELSKKIIDLKDQDQELRAELLDIREKRKHLGAGLVLHCDTQIVHGTWQRVEISKAQELLEDRVLVVEADYQRTARDLKQIETTMHGQVSLIIQRAYRCWQGRCRLEFVVKGAKVLRLEAHAGQIQRVYRGWIGRQQVNMFRSKLQDFAIIQIQRVLRGFIGRKECLAELVRRDITQRADAVRMIQKLYRGYKSREIFMLRREEVKQLKAARPRHEEATSIQRFVRGMLARKQKQQIRLELSLNPRVKQLCERFISKGQLFEFLRAVNTDYELHAAQMRELRQSEAENAETFVEEVLKVRQNEAKGAWMRWEHAKANNGYPHTLQEPLFKDDLGVSTKEYTTATGSHQARSQRRCQDNMSRIDTDTRIFEQPFVIFASKRKTGEARMDLGLEGLEPTKKKKKGGGGNVKDNSIRVLLKKRQTGVNRSGCSKDVRSHIYLDTQISELHKRVTETGFGIFETDPRKQVAEAYATGRWRRKRAHPYRLAQLALPVSETRTVRQPISVKLDCEAFKSSGRRWPSDSTTSTPRHIKQQQQQQQQQLASAKHDLPSDNPRSSIVEEAMRPTLANGWSSEKEKERMADLIAIPDLLGKVWGAHKPRQLSTIELAAQHVTTRVPLTVVQRSKAIGARPIDIELPSLQEPLDRLVARAFHQTYVLDRVSGTTLGAGNAHSGITNKQAYSYYLSTAPPLAAVVMEQEAFEAATPAIAALHAQGIYTCKSLVGVHLSDLNCFPTRVAVTLQELLTDLGKRLEAKRPRSIQRQWEEAVGRMRPPTSEVITSTNPMLTSSAIPISSPLVNQEPENKAGRPDTANTIPFGFTPRQLAGVTVDGIGGTNTVTTPRGVQSRSLSVGLAVPDFTLSSFARPGVALELPSSAGVHDVGTYSPPQSSDASSRPSTGATYVWNQQRPGTPADVVNNADDPTDSTSEGIDLSPHMTSVLEQLDRVVKLDDPVESIVMHAILHTWIPSADNNNIKNNDININTSSQQNKDDWSCLSYADLVEKVNGLPPAAIETKKALLAERLRAVWTEAKPICDLLNSAGFPYVHSLAACRLQQVGVPRAIALTIRHTHTRICAKPQWAQDASNGFTGMGFPVKHHQQQHHDVRNIEKNRMDGWCKKNNVRGQRHGQLIRRVLGKGNELAKKFVLSNAQDGSGIGKQSYQEWKQYPKLGHD